MVKEVLVPLVQFFSDYTSRLTENFETTAIKLSAAACIKTTKTTRSRAQTSNAD
jgi:hypothetical protein